MEFHVTGVSAQPILPFTVTAIRAMQSLAAIPVRLPAWLRSFLGPTGSCAGAEPAKLRYDEWLQDTTVITSNKRASLPARFRLGTSASKAITLHPAIALKLTCVTGALWVTRGRDHADYVLSTGQSLQVESDGEVVVLAIQYGLLQVEPSPRTQQDNT